MIAEAGVNHDGSVADAHALIDLAADSRRRRGQVPDLRPAALVSATAAAAAYQTASTGARTQRELLEQYVLPPTRGPSCGTTPSERGIDFLSTAFDLASLDLVCDLGVQALKLGSGELTNQPLLDEVARRGLPVLCSTGMGTADEVADAVLGWLARPAARRWSPAALRVELPGAGRPGNLRALSTMRRAVRRPGRLVRPHRRRRHGDRRRRARGAAVLEKHVTLDHRAPARTTPRARTPTPSRPTSQAVRDAHAALGDGVKRPVPAEAENIAAGPAQLARGARPPRRGPILHEPTCRRCARSRASRPRATSWPDARRGRAPPGSPCGADRRSPSGGASEAAG